MKSDKQLLKSSAWLNCRLIDGCQQLLHDAFPQVGGLQPPYLWQKQQFKEVQGEFVQILNVYINHIGYPFPTLAVKLILLMFTIVPMPP